jgi:hypothetical protein
MRKLHVGIPTMYYLLYLYLGTLPHEMVFLIDRREVVSGLRTLPHEMGFSIDRREVKTSQDTSPRDGIFNRP